MTDISPIDLQKALGGAQYPADREALVECARKNKADDSVTDRLTTLRENVFEGPDDVTKAVFGKRKN